MSLQKVIATTDESGHWYVYPESMREEFNKLSNEIIEKDYDQDLIDEFEKKFSKYMTGGDLNNTQLYAEIL